MKAQEKSIEHVIEDLKESNMLGQLLLDNADEALFFYSMDEKLIYVSHAFEKITGYTIQELYEKNFIPYVKGW
ncbi:MAG: PAS domain S-box protein [Gammaproteobacteria bacterium]